MPILNPRDLTTYDIVSRMGPDHMLAPIHEALAINNEALDFFAWDEATGMLEDQYTTRVGLPTAYWKALGSGTPPSKSRTARVTESLATCEARSQVEVLTAKATGNVAAVRMSEDIAFLEAMNQSLMTSLLYGSNGADANMFLGLSPRYSQLTGAAIADNVISGLGNTNGQQTSVWLLGLGKDSLCLTYPKGSGTAGLTFTDRGVVTLPDTSVGALPGALADYYLSVYNWMVGLRLKNWANTVRICNLDVPAMRALTGVHAPTALTNVIHLMTEALSRPKSLSAAKFLFLAPRVVCTALRRVAMEKSANAVALESAANQFGHIRQGRLSFMGVPVVQCDSILLTESFVA